MFIACVDGLKGFPEAIESVYPETQVQLCIVHMVRNSLRFVPWKDKKAVVADLKTIYTVKPKRNKKLNIRFGKEALELADRVLMESRGH